MSWKTIVGLMTTCLADASECVHGLPTHRAHTAHTRTHAYKCGADRNVLVSLSIGAGLLLGGRRTLLRALGS